MKQDSAHPASPALKQAVTEAVEGVKLFVGYDGSAYHGWQRQAELPTIQQALEEAIEAIVHQPVEVRGTGRTDAGVHAIGQIAAFDSPVKINERGWLCALNGKLPRNIAVRKVEFCDIGFQPRFDARDKTYRYVYHLAENRDPLWYHRAWHLGPRRARPNPTRKDRTTFSDWLDIDAMHAAAKILQGTHDFHAFRSARDTRETTVRTLFEVSLRERFAEHPELLALEIRGTAFMQNMVRIIAGTLVDVGREYIRVEAVRDLLRPDADRKQAGETAPPEGLYLVSITPGRIAHEAAKEANDNDSG